MMLDAERALIQLDGGKQAPGPVTPIGWDINFLTPGTFTEYSLNFNIGTGTFITATLDWDRIITESDGDNIIEATDTYAFSSLPEFDLAIFFRGNLVAFSGSLVDNVEPLH